ncbi:hypothetical protein HMPREF9134_01177 [Porphyromonas catoniae F0037]|uniref:Uncharacterized protein n=1 Tax=Porphyromonas catoniae F0037 TaxID=1127696 RepID=L1NC44_9PORP|nr:hypothetical protein HMPREF9134_01177 [Porphyromonas catoniae F0037]
MYLCAQIDFMIFHYHENITVLRFFYVGDKSFADCNVSEE